MVYRVKWVATGQRKINEAPEVYQTSSDAFDSPAPS